VLARFLFLVGQFLSKVSYPVLQFFDLDDIGVRFADLEGGGLDFHFEISDVCLGLSDMILGAKQMFSDLVVVQVQSVDFFHQKDNLDDSFSIIQPQSIIGLLVNDPSAGSLSLLLVVLDGDFVLVDGCLILVNGRIELLDLGLVDIDVLFELDVDCG
jgi:hypothetical protein